MTTFKYLPFVDGLRAIAVLFVIFFHFELGFPGGYIGVDIFFVISGFLITSLIIKDLETGTFTLIGFWERRARRILPCLIVVVAVTLAAGWFILLPRDFIKLGWSTLFQSVFLQNVVFWQGQGYFAAPSALKPLLHTWSLAIEEQFYLLFPFLMVALFRKEEWRQKIFLLFLMAISLITSIITVKFAPGAAFYLLPSRAWELLLGAMVATVPGFNRSRTMQEIGTGVAFTLIFIPALVYSPDTPFPGWAAIPPCAGTAIIIYLNHNRVSTVCGFLASKPMVFIGLLSYSLYLWHWPIWVYWRYWMIETVTLPQKAALILVCLLFAVLTWKFVETPFRKKTLFPARKSIFLFSGASLLLCALIGFLIIACDGLKWRLPEEVSRHDETARETLFLNEMTPETLKNRKWTKLGTERPKPQVIVWGDSLAMALCPMIDVMLRENGFSGIAITRSATAPLLHFDSMSDYALKEQSTAFNNAVLAFIREERPKIVILVAAWSRYAPDQGSSTSSKHRGDFWQALTETLTILKDMGTDVWLVLEPPIHVGEVPRILARRALFGSSDGPSILSPEKYDKSTGLFNMMLKESVRNYTVVIEPETLLRKATSDGTFFLIADESGNALYKDHVHLSSHGSKFLRSLFEKPLKPHVKDLEK